MDASEATRARRRLEDNKRRGILFTLEEIITEIRDRDRRDSQRADSPLTKTKDAVYLDTSEKTIEEVVQAVLRLVEEQRSTLQPKSAGS
jgi:cytidylate kinase